MISEASLFGFDLDPIINFVGQPHTVVAILVVGVGAVAIYALAKGVKKVEVPQEKVTLPVPTASQWLESQHMEIREPEQPTESEEQAIPDGHSRLSIALEELVVRGLGKAQVEVRFTKTIPLFLKGDELTAKLDDGQIGELAFVEKKEEAKPEKRADVKETVETQSQEQSPSQPPDLEESNA